MLYSKSRDPDLTETMKAVAKMIHPDDIPVQALDDEDIVNSVVFRSEVDLYKRASVMAVDSYDSKGNLLGRICVTSVRHSRTRKTKKRFQTEKLKSSQQAVCNLCAA